MKLVLLPGMDGTGVLFSEFKAALPATFEAVVVSYPTERYLPYSELEDIVRAACPVSEPFVLIAESFSTPLALKYAATNPLNLAGVVLCAGFARSPVRSWRRIVASFFARVMFYLPMPDIAARRWLVGADAPPSLLISVRSVIASVKPRVLAERLRAVLACDVRAAAGEIQVPTLYIRAEQDQLVRTSCAEELERINPHIVVASLHGPHLLLQRQPRMAAATVLEFVRSRCARVAT